MTLHRHTRSWWRPQETNAATIMRTNMVAGRVSPASSRDGTYPRKTRGDVKLHCRLFPLAQFLSGWLARFRPVLTVQVTLLAGEDDKAVGMVSGEVEHPLVLGGFGRAAFHLRR